LKNISDDDCIILGLNPKKCRPEDMILKIFPVPPVPVRPSVRIEGSSITREDDLTRKLADIVKKNNLLAQTKESISGHVPQHILNQSQLLQYHIATYLDNETPLILKSEQKGKVMKSLTSRLKGKEGRLRSNLMGKRNDFSARTVITPDPSIDINQVGVPISIAMNLTYPEVVTPYNIEMMRKLVLNGRDIYPGANFVIRKSDSETDRNLPIDLRYRKEKIDLRYGDIVERHLTENDIVLLNRQPTLHKQSMMGHYVHVIQDQEY
jgi:DNA-directed RNA polymerase II subunit RPB1